MSMMKALSKLKRGKAFRDGFSRAQLTVGIPFQVRAIRNKRGLGQAQLAELAGMKQPRIAAIERVGGGALNLNTLLRLAAAFDVGLLVKFVPFGELLRAEKDFQPDTFNAASFESEAESLGAAIEAIEKMEEVTTTGANPEESRLSTMDESSLTWLKPSPQQIVEADDEANFLPPMIAKSETLTHVRS